MPSPSLSEATAMRLLNSVVAGTSVQQHQETVTPLVTEPGLYTPDVQPQTQTQTVTDERPSGSNSNNNNNSSDAKSSPLSLVLMPTSSNSFSQKSEVSVQSANEFGNSCRICRWNRSDMKIIHCPCKCKGSVGFIHLKCLKRWIMHRRDNRCEICNAPFEITEERVSFKQMMSTFWCSRCCGLIMKHLLFSASLMPLAHVVLQQVLQCMDNLNHGSSDQLTLQEVFVASCALLTSSALFFHFFEFVTTRFILIRNILRHWWMFGSTSDFALVDIDDDTFDLF